MASPGADGRNLDGGVPCRAILIDSGCCRRDVDEVIAPALAELGLGPADLALVLATHSHGDHVGGHRRLAELGVKSFGVWRGGADKLCDPPEIQQADPASLPRIQPRAAAGIGGGGAGLVAR